MLSSLGRAHICLFILKGFIIELVCFCCFRYLALTPNSEPAAAPSHLFAPTPAYGLVPIMGAFANDALTWSQLLDVVALSSSAEIQELAGAAVIRMADVSPAIARMLKNVF